MAAGERNFPGETAGMDAGVGGGGDAKDTAESAVRAWARARSERRLEEFLSAYSAEFLAWEEKDRRAWETSQRTWFAGGRWTVIDISDLKVELVKKNIARARLTEVHRSEPDRGQVRKTLLLRLESGVWRIIEERADPIP
jgi:hypothetical protein